MNHNRKRENREVHAHFISASLEVASTFLTIAASAYSSGENALGDRAIAKASRSLDHADRFMGYVSTISPVAATVLRDKLTLLRRERDRVSGHNSANVIEFPAA